MTPRELCDAGRLGNLEANVMAGRALLGVFHLPDAQCRCALLLVQEKVLQGGTSKTPEQRAFKRISPKYLDVCVVSLPIAQNFCGALLQTISHQNPHLKSLPSSGTRPAKGDRSPQGEPAPAPPPPPHLH